MKLFNRNKKEREDFAEEPVESKIKIGSTVKDIVDVKITKEKIIRQMPFILFLSVLVIFYIANRYNAEKIVRQSVTIKRERSELRSEHISIAAELMKESKQSIIINQVDSFGLGLVENTEPPIKLLVEKK
jgi:hypothetical protein